MSFAVWPAADHPEAVYQCTGVPHPRAARGHSGRTSGAPSYLSLRCRGVRRNTHGTPCSFGDLPRRARYPRGRRDMCAQEAPAWSSWLASRGSHRRRNVYLVAPIGSICWNLTWETNGGQLRRDTRRAKGSDRCRRRIKPTPRLHVDLHATAWHSPRSSPRRSPHQIAPPPRAATHLRYSEHASSQSGFAMVCGTSDERPRNKSGGNRQPTSATVARGLQGADRSGSPRRHDSQHRRASRRAENERDRHKTATRCPRERRGLRPRQATRASERAEETTHSWSCCR